MTENQLVAQRHAWQQWTTYNLYSGRHTLNRVATMLGLDEE